MTDTTIIDDDDTETHEQRVTKRALIEHGIEALPPPDPSVTVQHHPGGGVSQVNLPQVVEIAKFMSGSKEGVPPHCRGNVGICLRVTFQAVEWQMSPFSVADLSYVVNGRLAYMSQLIHAVVEARAPLQHRLECEYNGENGERTCTVRGYFTTGDMREYTTPMTKDIRVKNSPLWKDDPDQQLFYYASRSWARKWCPDVLLGVYTKEELQDSRMAEEAELGLHARLSSAARSDEGHKIGHVESELSQISADGGKIIEHDETKPKKQKTLADRPRKHDKGGDHEKVTTKPATEEAPPKKAAKPEKMPTDVDEWLMYVKRWLKLETDADAIRQRWADERKMRNALQVTAEDRAPMEELKDVRIKELES